MKLWRRIPSRTPRRSPEFCPDGRHPDTGPKRGSGRSVPGSHVHFNWLTKMRVPPCCPPSAHLDRLMLARLSVLIREFTSNGIPVSIPRSAFWGVSDSRLAIIPTLSDGRDVTQLGPEVFLALASVEEHNTLGSLHSLSQVGHDRCAERGAQGTAKTIATGPQKRRRRCSGYRWPGEISSSE
jgi:hypothetical protein